MAVDRDVRVGGNRITITEAGQGGRPLLLLHGFTGARTDFERCIDPLAELGWHIVAPDQRGHGDSDKPADEASYSFDLFRADALELADVLGWSTFALLGHSMGGMIAQLVATGSPDRVAALVLMDTSGAGLEVDEKLRDLGIEVARTQGTGVIADLTAGKDGPLTNEAYLRACAEDPTYEARGERNLRAASGAMYAAMLAAITDRTEHYDALVAVTCPTLVIVGSFDEPFIEPSRRMASMIPAARLEVIEGGGHSPQFEAPDAWWQVLSGFLAEVAAGTGEA